MPPEETAPLPPERDDFSDVVRAINAFYEEAEDAKGWRLTRNKENREAFLGQQDWSEKIPGQSREFLPKTGVAVEQFAAFFKRALTQAGPDWFELRPPVGAPLDGSQCKRLLNNFFDDCLLDDNVRGSIHTALSDVARLGATESLCILKVHGNTVIETRFENGRRAEGPVWKLRVDVVPFESYFPDPSGKGLYEIHEVERDLHEVEARAEEGLYDAAEVSRLRESMEETPQKGDRRAEGVGQSHSSPPKQRHKVVIREFWGTLLDDNGHVLRPNCVAAVANEKFLIRPPAENPFWHGQSPFVVAPIIRVPKSVHHKALFDEAARLNLALNELYNLFIDGALASVWGIRQLRKDYLEDENQVSEGVPQGETLVVNSNLPPGERVLEVVATGQVPQDAMAIFDSLNKEFTQAALTSEMRMGQLAGKSGTRATEIVEVSNSVSAVMDGIAGDLERTLITPLVRKAFLCMMQFLDHTPVTDLVDAVGVNGAFALRRLQPEERFSLFATANFKVRGLTAVLEKVRNFQKLVALLQVVTTNPIFLQAFFTKYDPNALLAYLMKTLQLDPSDFTRAGRESESSMEAELAALPMFQQLVSQRGEGAGGPNNPNMGGAASGGTPVAADVNQQINPMSGMTANA